MGEAFITRRGGGGLSPNNAVIHVNAPVGSTIEFSKGGVTVKELGPGKGHTNSDGTSADWYLPVSAGNFGSWTVTASLDTDSASQTVTVDAAKQYDVVLMYEPYLFKDGNQYTPITGGWEKYTSAKIYNENYSEENVAGVTDVIRAKELASSNWTHCSIGTVDAIDLTRYKTIEYYADSATNNDDNGIVVIAAKTGNQTPVVASLSSATGKRTADISSLAGSYYICVYARSVGSNYHRGDIKVSSVQLKDPW